MMTNEPNPAPEEQQSVAENASPDATDAQNDAAATNESAEASTPVDSTEQAEPSLPLQRRAQLLPQNQRKNSTPSKQQLLQPNRMFESGRNETSPAKNSRLPFQKLFAKRRRTKVPIAPESTEPVPESPTTSINDLTSQWDEDLDAELDAGALDKVMSSDRDEAVSSGIEIDSKSKGNRRPTS